MHVDFIITQNVLPEIIMTQPWKCKRFFFSFLKNPSLLQGQGFPGIGQIIRGKKNGGLLLIVFIVDSGDKSCSDHLSLNDIITA